MGGFGVPFRFNMHLLGGEIDEFRTLEVHFDSVFQRWCLPLHVWGEHVFIFSAKISQDTRQFLGVGFGLLFVSKCTF